MYPTSESNSRVRKCTIKRLSTPYFHHNTHYSITCVSLTQKLNNSPKVLPKWLTLEHLQMNCSVSFLIRQHSFPLLKLVDRSLVACVFDIWTRLCKTKCLFCGMNLRSTPTRNNSRFVGWGVNEFYDSLKLVLAQRFRFDNSKNIFENEKIAHRCTE